MRSKSVASAFTYLEGDDMRLTKGSRNKISSNGEDVFLSIASTALAIITINKLKNDDIKDVNKYMDYFYEFEQEQIRA